MQYSTLLYMHSKDTGHVRPIVTGSAFERFPSCLTSCFARIVSPEPQFGPETRPSIVPDVPDFPLWIILLGLPRGILQWTANDMQSDGAKQQPCVSQRHQAHQRHQLGEGKTLAVIKWTSNVGLC